MISWAAAAPSVLASFMASSVEFVEALTIVLAVGVVRGWRSALIGVAAALAVLVTLIAILGPSLMQIPLNWVQIFVGTLLLLFGLRWLRKAILRAAGVLPLHDEAKAFEQQTASLRAEGAVAPRQIDKLAFATSFKIVMLEGIEVVFIVIAIGASGQMLIPASIGAALALVAVILLGLALHRPLTRVPENSLKFGVGVMLSAFGVFWVGEGIGLQWPSADWSLLALIAAFLLIALVLVQTSLRAHRTKIPLAKPALTPTVGAKTKSGIVTVIGKELLGLFLDDGWLASGTVIWVLIGWLFGARVTWSTYTGSVMFTVGLAALLAMSVQSRAKS